MTDETSLDAAQVKEMIAAVKSGDAARVAQLLLAEPALANARADTGESAVLLAAYYGRREIGAMLLATDPTLTVFEAAATGQAASVARALAQEPGLVAAWSPDGFTPLHLAAFFGHAAVAELLLAQSAPVDPESRNLLRVRPMHSAAAGQSLDIVRLLLAHGADVTARQEGGFTALHSAAQNGQVEMMALLLAQGADPSAVTDDGRTPLSFAEESGSEEAVVLLRRHLSST
jgi:ankyrin repeat protein